MQLEISRSKTKYYFLKWQKIEENGAYWLYFNKIYYLSIHLDNYDCSLTK